MSQCDRVIDVLCDGKPHSIQEIHRRAGSMRLNSRISDLRRWGLRIVYFRKDGLHTYQLLNAGTAQAAEEESGASPPLLGPSPVPSPLAADEGSPPGPPVDAQVTQAGQLSIPEAV